MGILFKFTLKSIGEKKFRTFLILLSISLSVALSLSSFAMRDVVKNGIMSNVLTLFGNANINVMRGEHSLSNPKIKDLGEAEKFFEHYAGQLTYTANLLGLKDEQNSSVTLRGIALEDAKAFGQLSLKKDLGLEFEGDQIYISEKTAEQYHYQLGQYLELSINEVKKKFLIAGIANNSGALASQGDNINMMVPAKTLSSILGYRGQYMQLLFKTAEGVNLQEAITALKKIYPRDKVDESVPWEQIDSVLNMILVPFIFMLILVLATAVFIIFTAFKVITKEKLPVLGTFRSIGATKRSVDFILLLESFMYGLLGGFLGILLGKAILYGIAFVLVNNLGAPTTVSEMVKIDFSYYLSALFFGVLLSIVSSLVPIISVSKLSVRDIVLGFSQQFKDISFKQTVFAFLLLSLALVMPYWSLVNQNTALDLLSVIMLCVALLMLVPLMVKLLLQPLIKISKFLFGNLGMLAAKNLSENRSVVNNIALLTIGIASILFINTLSDTITKEVVQAYSKASFDIVMDAELSRDDLNRIRSIEGVEGLMPHQTAVAYFGDKDETEQNEKVNVSFSGNDKALVLFGVDSHYRDYWNYEFESPEVQPLKLLDQPYQLIMTRTAARKYNYKIGDTVRLRFNDNKAKNYTLVATFDSKINNGFFALTNAKTLLKDASLENYSEVLIKAQNTQEVVKQINDKFANRGYLGVQTLAERKASDREGNAVVIGIFSAFSIIALVIGSIGILNNFLVSLMARQKSIAVMKSVGMSRKQTFRMLALEAVISGTIGGITGIVGGILLTKQVGQFLRLLEVDLSIRLSLSIMLSGLLLSIVISLLSTILPARKVARQNIVSAIKYE